MAAFRLSTIPEGFAFVVLVLFTSRCSNPRPPPACNSDSQKNHLRKGPTSWSPVSPLGRVILYQQHSLFRALRSYPAVVEFLEYAEPLTLGESGQVGLGLLRGIFMMRLATSAELLRVHPQIVG